MCKYSMDYIQGSTQNFLHITIYSYQLQKLDFLLRYVVFI